MDIRSDGLPKVKKIYLVFQIGGKMEGDMASRLWFALGSESIYWNIYQLYSIFKNSMLFSQASCSASGNSSLVHGWEAPNT